MNFEIQVHDDGDTEIRIVPRGYTSSPGTTNVVCQTEEEARHELKSYGRDPQNIDEAFAALHKDKVIYEWVPV
jgi:hypothetical protein